MANDTINIKAVLDSTAVDTSLLGLKKSIRELSAIKLDILPKAQADQVKARIGELINDSKDLKQSLSTLDKNDFAQNAAKLLTPLVGTFTALGSAAELFGVESEGLNKILQKTQSITIGLMAIQQIADSEKLKSTAAYLGLQIKSFFWTGAQTKATVGATIAQRALNIAMSLNPIGAVIAAITALIGVLYLFNKSQETTTENELETQKAMDGTIIKSDALRESYNETFKTVRDLELEYRKITGVISEFGFELETLVNTNNDALYQINQDTAKALTEYEDKWSGLGGAVRKFVDNFRYLFTGESNQQKELKAIRDKEAADKLAQENINAQKLRNIIATNRTKQEQEDKKAAKEAAETRKKNYEDYVKSLKEIDDKYADSLKKIKDTTKSSLDVIKNFTYEQLSEFDKAQYDLVSKSDEAIKQLNDNFQANFNERIAILNLLDQKLQLLLQKPIVNKDEIEKTKKAIEELSAELAKMEIGGGDYKDLQKNIKNIVDYYNKLISNNEIQNNLDKWADGLSLKLKKIEKLLNNLSTGGVMQLDYFGPMDDNSVKRYEKYTELVFELNKAYLEQSITLDDLYVKLKNVDEWYSDVAPFVLDSPVTSNKDRGFSQIGLLRGKEDEEAKALREQLRITKEYYDTLKQAEGLSETDIENLDLEMKDRMSDMLANFRNRWQGIKGEIKDSVIEVLQMVSSAVGEIFSRSISEKFDKLNYMLDKELDGRQKSLENQLEMGLLTQQEYDDKSAELDELSAKKELDLKVRQFKQEKALAMTQIVIDTALAVAKSWGQGGGLFGLPLSTIAAVGGALQLAVVASTNPPTFEQGGLIDGKSHMFGGTIIEAEKGEYMINKNVVAQPGMLNYLENINKGNINTISDSTIEKIVSRISSIPVINVESNTTRVQRTVRNIETRSRY